MSQASLAETGYKKGLEKMKDNMKVFFFSSRNIENKNQHEHNIAVPTHFLVS